MNFFTVIGNNSNPIKYIIERYFVDFAFVHTSFGFYSSPLLCPVVSVNVFSKLAAEF